MRSELEGYMITVSSIGDNQHSEEKVAARFLCEEEPTDAVFSFFFLVVALCVAAAEREP